MTFRSVAISVFALGVLSFVLSLVLGWSQSRAPANPAFAAATTLVTGENFSDVVLANGQPVVVDFYGDYCPVCRQLEPRLVKLAEEYSDTAVFTRVNVQDASDLIQRYGVKQVPTLVVFHQGEIVFQGAGLSALPSVKAVLEATNTQEAP
ncbi:MAG: thioredoxin family protein [Maioricimonas sp. JB045]